MFQCLKFKVLNLLNRYWHYVNPELFSISWRLITNLLLGLASLALSSSLPRGQHQLVFVLFGNVHHFHHLFHGHTFVHMQRDVYIGLLPQPLLQHGFQIFEIHTFGLDVVFQVARNAYRCRWLGRRLVLLWGSNSLRALGCTKVEVIIKKMSNRNTKSVIDDMLNSELILLRLRMAMVTLQVR
jgi:hypothetical protein